jgi:hypothetical protein
MSVDVVVRTPYAPWTISHVDYIVLFLVVNSLSLIVAAEQPLDDIIAIMFTGIS